MKMENLRDLKDVFIVVYAKMVTEVPLRSNLPFDIVELTKKSVLKFAAMYSDFEKLIGNDEEKYAHWLNLEFQVMTLLNGDATLLSNHSDMIFNTLLETPAGAAADVFDQKTEKKTIPKLSRSAQILLGFRIFLDAIDVVVEDNTRPPVPAPNHQPLARS